MDLNRGQKVSDLIVGATVGAFMVYVSWKVLPLAWLRWVAAGYSLFEAWTLINRWTDDTLSAAVRRLNERQPIVGHTFWLATGWAIGLGYIDPLSVFIGLLLGHWFFSMQGPKADQAAAIVAATEAGASTKVVQAVADAAKERGL